MDSVYRLHLADKMLNGQTGKMVIPSNDNRGNLWTYYSAITLNNWSIATLLEEGDALSEVSDFILTEVIKGIILLAGLIIMTFLVAGTVTKQLGNVTRQVNSLAGSRHYKKLTVTSQDEIGVLVNSFNDRIMNIESRDQEIKELNHRFKFAFQATNDGIFDWY